MPNQINAAARTVSKRLDELRKETVDALKSQQDEKLAAAMQRAKPRDPMERMYVEMREREIRDAFRGIRDPLDIETRVRQSVAQGSGDELITALVNAPIPIVQSEFLDEMRSVVTERDHPELGELAQLRQIYTRLIGIAKQSLLAASGGDAVAVNPRTPSVDTRKPYTVSGAPIPEVVQ